MSGLNEEDERSEENLDIIANVYENITELVHTGQIMVSENVRKRQSFKAALHFNIPFLVYSLLKVL